MNNSSNITFLFCLSALCLAGSRTEAASVAFSGLSHPAIQLTPENNTGLDAIFVIYDSAEIQDITVSGITGTDIAVSKYSNMGGGYAIDVPYTFADGNIVISDPEGETGYIVSENGRNFCFWIVDYLPHKFTVDSFHPEDTQNCDATVFDFIGNADAIKYFTIDGRPRTLGREIRIMYETLEWNEDNLAYSMVQKTPEYDYLSRSVSIMPPFYASTGVTLSGDRFLREWGIPLEIEIHSVSPNGIAVMSAAEQEGFSNSSGSSDDSEASEGSGDSEDSSDTVNPDDTPGSNMIKTETNGLGGSAPAVINFTGYITDAVLHTEWQMASDPDFNNIEYRWNEQDISYTFTEEGKFYLRFIGSNADGSCEAFGETYTVSIGASDLRIPNAFSPNDDGVNDIWKVGYRSLVEFKCWIFDSRGTQLFYFDRPEDGWDGKYRGKTVSPGVYYYVIEAKGADGKKYKKGGDINIVGYRKIGTGSSAPPAE